MPEYQAERNANTREQTLKERVRPAQCKGKLTSDGVIIVCVYVGLHLPPLLCCEAQISLKPYTLVRIVHASMGWAKYIAQSCHVGILVSLEFKPLSDDPHRLAPISDCEMYRKLQFIPMC